MEVRPGFKLTEAGLIPEDWDAKPAKRLGTPVRGGSPRPAGDPRYFNGSYIPWLTVSALTNIPESQLVVRETATSLTEAGSLLSRILNPGTLIIANSGATLGVAKILGIKCCANDGIAALLNIGKDVSSRYLAHFINTKTNYLREVVATGNGQPNLNTKLIGAFAIPLPPTKAEQEAIAEALGDADALIESLEKLIAKKRYLKQGAMQQLLTGNKRLPDFEIKPGYKQTEVGVIPEDWSIVRASDACSRIQDGTHFSPRLGGSDHLYITSRNIRHGFLDISTAGRIDSAQHQAIYRRCDVQKGDVLLTKDGANTGNAALNTLDEEFSLLSSVAFLRFHDSKYCPAYFLQQILTSRGQRQIKDAMAGNAITRLTLEKIKKLSFPAPPTKSEQVAIASILSEMDAEIVALEGKLAKARQLNQGMMQELLAGRTRLI
jgi:type I restriction enzyme, S subunit